MREGRSARCGTPLEPEDYGDREILQRRHLKELFSNERNRGHRETEDMGNENFVGMSRDIMATRTPEEETGDAYARQGTTRNPLMSLFNGGVRWYGSREKYASYDMPELQSPAREIRKFSGLRQHKSANVFNVRVLFKVNQTVSQTPVGSITFI